MRRLSVCVSASQFLSPLCSNICVNAVFSVCYESHYPGCIFVAPGVWWYRHGEKMSCTCAAVQDRQTLRCRTLPLLVRLHPPIQLCHVPVLFLLHLPLSHIVLPVQVSPSLLSFLLYLYPNGFYHLRSYFPKLNDRPLLLCKCNRTTTEHYSSTQ